VPAQQQNYARARFTFAHRWGGVLSGLIVRRSYVRPLTPADLAPRLRVRPAVRRGPTRSRGVAGAIGQPGELGVVMMKPLNDEASSAIVAKNGEVR
jgi:hypothetical protein